jgi:hypothetical protein
LFREFLTWEEATREIKSLCWAIMKTFSHMAWKMGQQLSFRMTINHYKSLWPARYCEWLLAFCLTKLPSKIDSTSQ